MLLSFVRLPHPAACFAAVDFDVRRGKEETGRVGMGKRKKRDLIFPDPVQVKKINNTMQRDTASLNFSLPSVTLSVFVL